MKTRLLALPGAGFLMSWLVFAGALPAQVPAEYQDVLSFLGRSGDFKSGVLKVNVPRNDLKVRVAGVAVPTAFGFGGWVAMTEGERGQSVMMGDLVLLQEEVNAVMSALLDNGLEVTALHNHFFWDEPRLFFMHVHGMGKPADLARRIKPGFDLIGSTSRRPSSGAASPEANPGPETAPSGALSGPELSRIVGRPGETMGAVYKITVGREDLGLREMGAPIGSRMGLNSWAAFFGSDAKAVIAGDLAMLEDEVTPVLKSLRSHGLDVVALHQHLIGTRPMIIFLHYWGQGPAAQLAAGFKAALDQTSVKHP